jgi:hypothetical protein
MMGFKKRRKAKELEESLKVVDNIKARIEVLQGSKKSLFTKIDDIETEIAVYQSMLRTSHGRCSG